MKRTKRICTIVSAFALTIVMAMPALAGTKTDAIKSSLTSEGLLRIEQNDQVIYLSAEDLKTLATEIGSLYDEVQTAKSKLAKYPLGTADKQTLRWDAENSVWKLSRDNEGTFNVTKKSDGTYKLVITDPPE